MATKKPSKKSVTKPAERKSDKKKAGGSSRNAKPNISVIARTLDDAARNVQVTTQISDSVELTLAEAYEVQRQAIALRVRRGERRVGIKMGFTSRAKIMQMGISDMIWGRLTSSMIVEEGGPMDFSRFIHPRVEPEIAFLLKRPLFGLVTPMQAMDAVEAIAPALEIIDSRYDNFKFSLSDVVADNASSSGFVTGPWVKPDIDFSNLGLVLNFDGKPVQIGSTAAIMGHPIRSLVAAARFAAEAGEPLQTGWIVMAGGATAAEALSPNQHVEMEMEKMGRVSFTTRA